MQPEARVRVPAVGVAADMTRTLELLRLLARATAAANDAPGAREAIARTLEGVCSALGWDVGHAWLAAEDIARNASDQLRADAEERGASIALELAGSLPSVVASESALDQVIANLVENALEASARRIVLRSRRDAAELLLEVEDDGGGIAAGDLGQVTDPLFTTRRARGGSGLGLSLAHGIVRGHGGSLALASRIGLGTTVTVRFPVMGERNA